MSSTTIRIENATFDDFKMMVDVSRRLEDWEICYDDHQVYLNAFGEENITFLAAKNEGSVLHLAFCFASSWLNPASF